MINLRYLLPLNRYSRNGKKTNNPTGIIVHHGVTDGYGAIETRNYYENLKMGKNAVYDSAHYIVGLEGEVICCVPEDEIAYHRGNCAESAGSISIVYCTFDRSRELGRKTLVSLRRLIREIAERNNFDIEKDLKRHFDVSGKKCPLYYAANEDCWKRFKADIQNEAHVAKQLKKNADIIADRTAAALGVEKELLMEILEERAEVDIATLSKLTDFKID